MTTLAFHTVDVFTTTAFTGNPLAIVLQADTLSDQQMQTMAREFNLPETIFIQTPIVATNTAKVRIFYAGQRAALCRSSDDWLCYFSG